MWEIVLPNSTLLDGKIALKKQKRTELKVMQTSMQTRPEIYANSPTLYKSFSRGNVSEQNLTVLSSHFQY